MKVAVLGASGYTGQVLSLLLTQHKGVKELLLIRRGEREKSLAEIAPLLPDQPFLKEAEAEKADFFFLCLPDGESMKRVPALLQQGKRVVDLSGDYRVSAKAYADYYGRKHEDEKNLSARVYGMPDLFSNAITKAKLVANPGCYATAANLALYPLLKEIGLLKPPIIIDAKSGVSGAGRTPSLRTHFVEVNESIGAYNPFHHDQIPEIEETLSLAAGKAVMVDFVPHLLAQSHGIFCSVYASVEISAEDLLALYQEFYIDSPLIKVVDEPPKSRWVQKTPYCILSPFSDTRTKTVKIFSTLDNLWKGAASQAVENFNLMCGFTQTEGLLAK